MSSDNEYNYEDDAEQSPRDRHRGVGHRLKCRAE